jgi:hypothetical protein
MHDGAPPRDRQGGPAGAPGGERPRATGASAPHPSPAPDLQQAARDWITLWQSELTAAAADREWQESWQTLAGLWAGVAGAMLQQLPRGLPDVRPAGAAPPGGAGAAAPARPAPAAAASDARDAEIERLAGRVAELERRLADIERGGG